MRADASIRNAAISSATQAIQHYKIAQYGTVVPFAEYLSYDTQAELIKDKNANEMLNQATGQAANEKALS